MALRLLGTAACGEAENARAHSRANTCPSRSGADALGFALGAALSDEPSNDVSAEFQTWRVRRGEILRGAEFQNLTANAGREASTAIA
jgi:hypothetical protein